MVFAIPDWEDGGNTKNTVFSGKYRLKQQNGSPKSSQKSTPQRTEKLNSIAEKSKLISKANKKQHQRQKEKENRRKKKNCNQDEKVKILTTENVKNSLSNTIKQKTRLENVIPKTSNLKQKNKKKNKERHQKDNSDSSLKVDNLDTDKLDEVLLNAKKKKFNEALKRDDVEALLFSEDKSPEKNKPHTEQKQPLTAKETKQKITKNNKIVKAKNKNNVSKSIDKVKLTANGIKQNNKQVLIQEKNENFKHNETRLKSPQERKKDKIKLMLKEDSNRNTINFNRNKLRERMFDRLKSAQFRFLNEKLYTSSGSEASQLFQNDPSAFHNYHEGYQQQVKKWPVNPLDVIVKRIQKMPKSHLIADMGCGEAALAKRIPHTMRSFDLVAAVPGVEVCDMAHTPLLAASMDAVVYCLALMGTDLTTYLVEANRVLKLGGHLLIAEVESRFTDVNAFTKEVTRLGFKLVKLNNEHEVFFFMEFVKNQAPPVKKSKMPVLTLKPCIYKRR